MKHFVTLPYLLSMYSTSSGRGFLPLVTAAHEISPTCSCMRNPGEEECMIHIRGKNSHLSFGNKPDILQLRDLYSLLVVFNSCAKCQKYSQLGACFIFAKSYFDFYETLCIFCITGSFCAIRTGKCDLK